MKAHVHSSTRRRRALLAGTGLALIGGALAPPAWSVGATPTRITCGAVVTTNVRLTADLVDCPGPGLVVGAAGITIDLAHHIIDGTGVGAGIDNAAGHDGVTIKRGTLREFLFGVELLDASGNRIDRVDALSNIGGIVVSGGNDVELDRVTAGRSVGTGIEITFGTDITVRRSAAADNGLFGIVDRFSYGTRFERNAATGNGATGLVVDGSDGVVVERNDVVANDSDGIELSRVTDTFAERNHAIANAGNGITVINPGATLTRNRADANQAVGILADAGTIDGGGNRARGNLTGGCTGVACS